VAAWLPDMFCDIDLVKNHKAANNSTTTKARERISTDLEKCLMQLWLNLKTIKFYYIKIATDFY
jgi:hypothetical protein